MWPYTQACFCDLAFIIRKAIERAGYVCLSTNMFLRDCTNVVLGANMCVRYPPDEPIPEDSIIVQFEQLHDKSMHCTPEYLDMLSTHEVWDYNEANQKWLKDKLGLDVPLLKIGYEPEFEIRNPIEKDIDVLFYGVLNERRKTIRDECILRLPGRKIVFRDDLWDNERNDCILRAKCVLNIHAYEAMLFEYPRVSYLLNLGAFVISEVSNNDSEYAFLKNGICVCEYNQIVDSVVEMLDDDARRQRVSDTGYDIFRREVSSVPLMSHVSESSISDCYKYRLKRRFMIYDAEYDGHLSILYSLAKTCSSFLEFSSYKSTLAIWPLLKVCSKATATSTSPKLSLLRETLPNSELFDFISGLAIDVEILDDPEEPKDFDFIVFSGISNDTIQIWAPHVKSTCCVFSPQPTSLELPHFTKTVEGAYMIFVRNNPVASQ